MVSRSTEETGQGEKVSIPPTNGKLEASLIRLDFDYLAGLAGVAGGSIGELEEVGGLRLCMLRSGTVSLYQGSGDTLCLEVRIMFLVAVLLGNLGLGVAISCLRPANQVGRHALLLEVGVVGLVAVDCHAPAASAEPDPVCAVVDIPLMLVVPVKELALDGRRGEACAM